MSKELKALESINEIQCGYSEAKHGILTPKDICPVEFSIIETALKNSEDRHKRAKWANKKIEQDLVSIIKEKQKNAESQLKGTNDLDKRERLKGEIEAYYDIVCLIKFKYGIE